MSSEKLAGIHPFNNKIETGLRVLVVLNASYPETYDIQDLVYMDYLTVHSGDISDGLRSLHPSIPERKGEILVRRKIISESLEMLENRGLIIKIYEATGIKYSASETTTPFVESLNEQYLSDLNNRARWVIEKISKLSAQNLAEIMREYLSNNDPRANINLMVNE